MCSWIAGLGPHAKFQNNPSGAIREKRTKTKKVCFWAKYTQKLPKTYGRNVSIDPQIGMRSWIASLGPHAKFQDNPSGAIRELDKLCVSSKGQFL